MNLSTAGFNDGNASEGDEVSLVKSMDGVEPMEVGPAEPPTEEALAAGGAVNIWRWRNMGYLLQYYTVGLLYGGLPATIYGFFLGYLAVPSFVYSTVVQIVTLPWAFKFVLGMINDVYPLWGGYRRKPYMVIGWTLCCAVLLILAIQPLPEPYWCVSNETGEFITEIKDPATGDTTPATPCSPKTAEEGGGFAFLMCLAAFGYVVADVAADGLTVEYGRREPAAKRGTTQSTVYLVRTLGSITATVIVGLGMNGKLYNGTFDVSLSFPNICFIFSIPCALMIPASWLLVEETPVATVGPPGCCQRVCGRCHSLGRARTRHGTPDVSTVERLTLRDYRQRCWVLLQGKAFFYVVLYSFLSAAVATVTTTAQGNVQRYWAKVRNLQNQVFSMIGLGLFALGLYLVKRFFLHRSWRGMLLWTTIFLNVADSVFVFLTVFDVVRNQYFYLGETVLLTIPEAANFLVSTFVIVEMSDAGTEGMVYGLLTTVHNLGFPFARAVGNQIYGAFEPSLSSAKNYIEDDPSFRATVAKSFGVSYAFAMAALFLLPLMPDQKAMAQERKANWGSKRIYGWMTVVLVVVAWFYAITIDVMAMLPSTMCLKIAGGQGCDNATRMADGE